MALQDLETFELVDSHMSGLRARLLERYPQFEKHVSRIHRITITRQGSRHVFLFFNTLYQVDREFQYPRTELKISFGGSVAVFDMQKSELPRIEAFFREKARLLEDLLMAHLNIQKKLVYLFSKCDEFGIDEAIRRQISAPCVYRRRPVCLTGVLRSFDPLILGNPHEDFE